MFAWSSTIKSSGGFVSRTEQSCRSSTKELLLFCEEHKKFGTRLYNAFAKYIEDKTIDATCRAVFQCDEFYKNSIVLRISRCICIRFVVARNSDLWLVRAMIVNRLFTIHCAMSRNVIDLRSITNLGSAPHCLWYILENLLAINDN